jgi:hypothetical protein
MSATCPLCGLRYAGQSLLDLHIREDHAQRERGREPPAAPGDPPAAPGDPPAAPGDPPAATAAPEPASAPPPSREHPVTAAAPAATEAAPATDPAGLPGWAAAARRALSRLTRAGRETAGHPRQAA